MKKEKILTIVAFSLVILLLIGVTAQSSVYKRSSIAQLDLAHYQLQVKEDETLNLRIEKAELEKKNLVLMNDISDLQIRQEGLEKELLSRGTVYQSISEKEFYLFTCIVAREASPQGNYTDNYEAALDVATVIMNRLPYWGGTITKVVSAHTYNKNGSITWQFSTYPNYWQCTPQDYEIQACKDALAGKRSLAKNVLFFCTPHSYDKSAFFQSRIVVLRRHGHVFMKNP